MTRVKLISFVICLMLLLSSCSAGDTVLKVGSKDISADMYRYFYLNYKAENREYTEEELYEKSVEAISLDTAITELAKKYDVSLSKSDKKSVKEYVTAAIANYGGEDAYKKALLDNHLTEQLFEYLYSQQLLESNLRRYMYDEMNDIIRSDDAAFEADLEKNFMAAKQILIRNDEGDDKEKNKELADSLLKRVLDGEDFDTLISEYSEDSSARDDHVYHFTYGQMLLAFEEAVTATEPGELCSYVAESEAGYHIIMRLPLDREYIDNNYEDLRDAFKARRFNEIRQELSESLTVEKTKDFDKLDLNE